VAIDKEETLWLIVLYYECANEGLRYERSVIRLAVWKEELRDQWQENHPGPWAGLV
jgi:hypothetical protein